MERPTAERRAPAPPGVRRVDASMDLLNQIIRNPIDPDYRRAAERRGGGPQERRAGRPALTGAAVVLGVLFAVAGVQTTQQRPALLGERATLVQQAYAAKERRDALGAQVATERDRVRTLRSQAASDEEGRRLSDQLETVGAMTGAGAVTGPGLVVVVDDAATGLRQGRVTDRDLQQLVNALWESGGEAICINGHRLSSLTAIRGAGESITVDYRSLVHPYRVEAIGDPRTLSSRLAATSGGRTWAALRDRYHLRFEVAETRELRLPSDPGIALKHARRMS